MIISIFLIRVRGVARTGYSVPVRGALGAGLCTGTSWRAAVVAVCVTPWGGVGWGGMGTRHFLDKGHVSKFQEWVFARKKAPAGMMVPAKSLDSSQKSWDVFFWEKKAPAGMMVPTKSSPVQGELVFSNTKNLSS